MLFPNDDGWIVSRLPCAQPGDCLRVKADEMRAAVQLATVGLSTGATNAVSSATLPATPKIRGWRRASGACKPDIHQLPTWRGVTE